MTAVDHGSRTEADAGAYARAHAADDDWPDRLGPVPAGWGPYDEVPTVAELEP